ncbi:MAG: GvpL/GvpF family gas vesicle protein, partial [Solirubrobacterales bacterium]|nr:GvpL/GvpF family gas vesicle protein [Solirubrobacterales bacterium]
MSAQTRATEAPGQEAQEAHEPIYVYGVLWADQEAPKEKGIAESSLRGIASGKIAALVSDLGDLSLQLGREEMTTHVEVLDKAHQKGTVLPMRFGVVMDGEQAVKDYLLDRHREELEQQLNDLKGKVELRVRAVYEEETLLKEVISGEPEIARLRQELQGKPEDATYYARIRLGEMVSNAIQTKRDADAMAILAPLEPLAHATNVGEPPNERIALTASFLVDENRIEQFDKAVDEIG